MNTHSLHSLRRRQNVVPFAFFFLLIVAAISGLTAGVLQSSARASGKIGQDPQRPPFMPNEDIAKEFNDDDLKVKDDKPSGKWTYSTLPGFNQKNDPSVPAYVSGIQLLSGAGKHAGITKIKRVQVKNKSSQTIVSVQVRFEVFNFDEPEKVLLADTFPFANISIDPDAYRVVELRTLYPARMLKTLTKKSELYGDFGIRIEVQEARFADGTSWRRPEPVALLKSPYLNPSLGFRFPALATLASHIPPPLRSSDTK